ncbi:unnamed protein product, partial [marine sediment metagenome]
QVENWFLCIGENTFEPPSFESTPSMFYVKHENVIVAGHVEFYGFGKVQKCMTVGGDKYRLTEIPKKIYEAIFDVMMSDGENHLAPYAGEAGLQIIEPDSKIPKFRITAYWEPPGDYVKQLMEKRHFMLEQEFELIRPYLKKVYDDYGVKMPNYIDGKPLIQVSGKVH